ncbi:MAG TPA: hypothetical protein VMW91_07965 [Desulfosporosinus sp.]|nr:hypothetical protein [Desulfosporosinus sp.]
MKCPAEIDIKELSKDLPLTPRQIIDIEISLRRCTTTCKTYHDALNRRIIKDKVKKDMINDPVSQEQDKRRGWFRRLLR